MKSNNNNKQIYITDGLFDGEQVSSCYGFKAVRARHVLNSYKSFIRFYIESKGFSSTSAPSL